MRSFHLVLRSSYSVTRFSVVHSLHLVMYSFYLVLHCFYFIVFSLHGDSNCLEQFEDHYRISLLARKCANIYIYAGASIKSKSKQDIEIDAKLSAHSVRFAKEKISPSIVSKLSIQDVHNLGINDHNVIMSLRFACSRFGSYTPFDIGKTFSKNLI